MASYALYYMRSPPLVKSADHAASLNRRSHTRYNALMTSKQKMQHADLADRKVIRYGDPRLEEISTPVEQVDDDVRAMVERMFDLMFEDRGVGLAAPQIGVTVRLFVASPSFEPSDRRVYIDPEILYADGWQEGEEGCLSFPGISTKVKRRDICTVRAVNLAGETFEETAEGLLSRIFQHEIDHLDGTLLVHRMGSLAKMANRRILAELREANRPT